MCDEIASLAVLITCHNRKEKTLSCLYNVYRQKNLADVNWEVFLTDDGSTDGTTAAVKENYPEVNILRGNGSLFWTGGTRKAMKAAKKKRFDYYAWLNDDTMLCDDALHSLLDAYQEVQSSASKYIIMGGSVKDPESGKLTYGGFQKASKWHPLRFELIDPRETTQKCDVLNGNFVLFSHEVFEKVGNLHPELVHTEGDFEYCLRAKKRGVQPWIAPGYYGECTRNSVKGTWEDTSLPLSARYKKLFSIKGKPLHERYVYVSNHGGILWPAIYLWVYVKPLFEALKIPVLGSSNIKRKKHE